MQLGRSPSSRGLKVASGPSQHVARALAVHRTLQKTVAQPENASTHLGSLAQCALRVVQDQADFTQALLDMPTPEVRPAHAPPLACLAPKLPARPKASIAFQLECSVATYSETLSESMPQRPCALVTQHVRPSANALRKLTGCAPDVLLSVIDLQNMLLQATWQSDWAALWSATLGRWTNWLGLSVPAHTSRLAARRHISASLCTNLMQLWRGLLGRGEQGQDTAIYVAALARWPLISEVCDYDILRRSLLPARAPMLDVQSLEARLFEAVQTPGLSTRAALQLRLLAWRLAAFAPGAAGLATDGPNPRVKRFAQLHDALEAAKACLQASASEGEGGWVDVVAHSPNAQTLRQAEALTELVAATWAFRRGVLDVAEQ